MRVAKLEPTEVITVEMWRQAVLEQAGVDARIARRLAESDADLHAMLEAHDHGATDDQLRRIFL